MSSIGRIFGPQSWTLFGALLIVSMLIGFLGPIFYPSFFAATYGSGTMTSLFLVLIDALVGARLLRIGFDQRNLRKKSGLHRASTISNQ